MVSNKYPTAITLMSHKAKSSSGNFRAAYEQYNELYEIKYEIYNSIAENDIQSFISHSLNETFDPFQTIENNFGFDDEDDTLLELCCYYGAIDCFNFLRTKFKLNITNKCLKYSFLSGVPYIMNECLKYQKPDDECMEFAIASHNIDFVCFLHNEYDIKINLDFCYKYYNLPAFFVYFDLSKDYNQMFLSSQHFNLSLIWEYLLANGVDINKTYENNENALHIAAKENLLRFAKFLIAKGINTKSIDIYGNTALHLSVKKNLFEMAKVILSDSSIINMKNGDTNTAAHQSVINKNFPMLKLLIEHGADLNEHNRFFGYTVLHLAVTHKREKILEYLVTLAPCFKNNSLEKEFKDDVNNHASTGVDINSRDNDGKTALHIAVENNRFRFAEILISHGIDIDATDKNGNTALHTAVSKENIQIVKLLISYGIDIDATDKNGNTALHAASISNRIEVMEILLSHGANVNSKNKDGNNPLQYALSSINVKAAKLLISYGANLKELFEDGSTILLKTLQTDNEDFLLYLLRHYDFNSNYNDKAYLQYAKQNKKYKASQMALYMDKLTITIYLILNFIMIIEYLIVLFLFKS